MLAPCLVLVAAPAVVQIDGLRGATFDAAKFETEEGGQTLAHGDLDGDGQLDLIVPNAVTGVATLSLLFGREDGTFDPTVALRSE